MNLFFETADFLGPILWKATWQAAVLTGIVLLLQLLLRDKLSAAWRCGLWSVVLARCLLPVVPASPASLFRSASPPRDAAVSADVDQPREAASAAASPLAESAAPVSIILQEPADEPERRASASFPSTAAIVPSGESSTSPASAPDAARSPVTDLNLASSGKAVSAPREANEPARTWSRFAVAAWFGGFSALAVRRIASFVRLRKQMRSWRDADGPGMLALHASCRAQLSVPRTVPLRLADEGIGPAVVGVLRPVIVLPASIAESFSAAELEQVLLHELVHVRRHDVLLQRLWSLASCLHWFNPFVRLAAAQMQAEREVACDAAVLGLIGAARRRDYGDTLLKLADRFIEPRLHPGMVGVFASKDRLHRRIVMIARYRESPPRNLIGGMLVVLLVVAGLTEAGTPQADQRPLASAAAAAKNLADNTVSAPPKAEPAGEAAPDDEAAIVRKKALSELAAKIRAEEARYRNLELRLRRETRIVSAADPKGERSTRLEEAIASVIQGDREWRRDLRTQIRRDGERVPQEFIAACDGTDTRLVDYAGCATVHKGRNEMTRPPIYLTRTLLHWGLRHRLSDLIDPAARIRNDFGRAPTEFDSSLEGEETIDGLRCLKIKVMARTPERSEHFETLWLAPERNYLCVRFQDPEMIEGASYSKVFRTEEFQELAPGLWLPKRTKLLHRSFPLAGENESMDYEVTMVIDHAALDPRRAKEFFSEVRVPPGFEVYTLVNGTRPEAAFLDAAAAPGGAERLSDIIRAIRTGQFRTRNLAVTVDRSWTQPKNDFDGHDGRTAGERVTEVQIVSAGKSWVSETESRESEDGRLVRFIRTKVWDGEWTRSTQTTEILVRGIERDPRPAELPPPVPKLTAGLRRGPFPGTVAHGPYQFAVITMPAGLLSPSGIFGSTRARQVTPPSLADWLAKPEPAASVEYLGEEMRDGLRCAVLRWKRSSAGPYARVPAETTLIWLAIERAYLPVRVERYSPIRHTHVPGDVTMAGDLREIAPGIWYPFHIRQQAYETWSSDTLGFQSFLGRDPTRESLMVHWWAETRTLRAVVNPIVRPAQFAELVVPAGTPVVVLDEAGRQIGNFEQAAAGNLTVSDEKFAEWKGNRERRAILDGMIRKPAPPFPVTDEWLNSPALTWNDLAGKKVVLLFWNGPNPTGDEVVALQSFAAKDFAIIGVRPAGTGVANAQKDAEANRMRFPIVIDVPVDGDREAPGQFHQQFAQVRPSHYVVVVDGEGCVRSHGDQRNVVTELRRQMPPQRVPE